jgi:Ser/Thr protein kinase RdoA (MazF antagonist)
LGRLHNIGAQFKAPHRLQLNPETYGYESLDYILTLPFIPPDLLKNIEAFLTQALERAEPFFEYDMEWILVHGDCHPGNILWNPDGPHLLDFDDMVIAPPVQDLWMLFYGTEEEQRQQKEAFFSGYETFREFDYCTLRLAEPLRTLRMIRHTAWIGKRHQEPIFQRSFPYYRERRYWEEFLLSMKEQVAILQET